MSDNVPGGDGNAERRLDRVLQFIEDRVDLGCCEEIRSRHVRALSWENVNRVPVTISVPAPPDWPVFPYNETYDSPPKMMYNELVGSIPPVGASPLTSLLCVDDFPLQIRANHGVGLFPSFFGAPSVISGNEMPWSKPIGGVRDAWALLDRGIPSLEGELLDRTLTTMAFYQEKLQAYPKCSRAIHITQPNLMGPFETAMSLFGSEILLAGYDAPARFSELLALLADTYVKACRLIRPHTTEESGEDGFIYIHWQMCHGACLIRDDSAIMLSPDLYETFVRPANERVFRALGSGAVHWCGRCDHLMDLLFATAGATCLDFGQPDLNDMRTWCERARENHIGIMRVLVAEDVLQEGRFREAYPTGVSLLVKVENVERGWRLMETVRRSGE